MHKLIDVLPAQQAQLQLGTDSGLSLRHHEAAPEGRTGHGPRIRSRWGTEYRRDRTVVFRC